MSGDLAFTAHYSQDGRTVTRYGDEWPQHIVIHGDLWRQMIMRKCLPWAVANVTFDVVTVVGPDGADMEVGRHKDGRAEFSMADGHYAQYCVTSRDELGDTVSLKLVEHREQIPPVKLAP